LIQDLRYAFRTLRRYPDFTTVAIVALALGIGANTAVFTVVNGVLLRPIPFPEADRLFLISYAPQRGPFKSGPCLSDRDYLAFRSQAQLFERVASFNGNAANLTGAGDPVRISIGVVTPDFFRVLEVNPAIGRSFLADEGQAGRDHVVVLSDKLWRNRFGADDRLVGKAIKLDGLSRTVIGIMPAGFSFPYDSEAWTPLAIRATPGNFLMMPVMGRLKAGVSPQQAKAEL